MILSKLAGLLKIIPVMELNYDLGGKIDSLAKVRTLKKACKKLADGCVEKGAKAKGYKFAVEHVLAPEYAQLVVNSLEEQLGKCDILVRELPAMVGAHMGVGGVGIQFVKCEG
jgi:fatty acid-binding protein DegV